MYSKKVKTPSDFLLLSNELENIRDFSGLAVLLGVNQDYLLMNILPSYTCFEIKKKSTLRKVYYPEYYVSEIQRTLNLYLTASYLTNYYLPTQLPVHSYIPRITLTEQSDSDICRNNKSNAEVHFGSERILKLDLANFFPSIKSIHVRDGLRRLLPRLPQYCIEWLVHLTTFEGFLPAGAPTSPTISNIILYDFDKFANSINGIKYSRYGDDLTFSAIDGRINLKQVERDVKIELEKWQFQIQEAKTFFLRKGQRLRITGVVLNEKLNISREYLKWLRAVVYSCESIGIEKAATKYGDRYFEKMLNSTRKKYRYIGVYVDKGLIKKCITNKELVSFLKASLLGHISYVSSVRGKDDVYVQNLRNRFINCLREEGLEKKEIEFEAKSFKENENLVYITNATSQSVVYYAYVFLKSAKLSDDDINRLRKHFSYKDSSNIDFKKIKENFINQSIYFLELYNYMFYRDRFKLFYESLSDDEWNQLFNRDQNFANKRTYPRWIYHLDFNCSNIRNNYNEEGVFHPNSGVFFEEEKANQVYNAYLLEKNFLDQLGMRTCLICQSNISEFT